MGQPGPCPDDGGRSVLLNGLTNYVSNAAPQSAPGTFSVSIWFRTAANYARGGRLIGFGNRTGTTISTQYDRHLYMTNAGTVVFGVYPGAVGEIVSPTQLDNGAWHHVVATLAPAGSPDPGMRLYVDGALAASNASVTTAES